MAIRENMRELKKPDTSAQDQVVATPAPKICPTNSEEEKQLLVQRLTALKEHVLKERKKREDERKEEIKRITSLTQSSKGEKNVTRE